MLAPGQPRMTRSNSRPSPGQMLATVMLVVAAIVSPGLEARDEPGDAGITSLIQTMFPKATVIGDKEVDAGTPAWPVYQLNEVIGYAYESKDLVDFPGFSGEQMNFLIGIDRDGELRGVEVLYHHEPIFMHGLGPQPFLDFLAQYAGHGITEQIVVGGGRGRADSDVTYFDGVTKATVSVNIANDTVLVSALKLARDRIEAFAQGAPAEVRSDVFEEKSWDELLEEQLIRRWSLDRATVEEALGSDLEDFYDDNLDLFEGDDITIYYGYLNVPTVGRNLLGDEGFEFLNEKLRPNEHAFFLMSEGFYGYVPYDYKPGTVPDRISLMQGGAPINIRDTNFVDANGIELMPAAPKLDNMKIFRTRAQAGLNPSAPMQLQLLVELKKNHLVSESASFVDQEYQLPAELFVEVESSGPALPRPMWMRMWESRALPVAVLLAGLGLLSVAFAMQRRLTARPLAFRNFRIAFLAFTLFFIGFYAQGQLSVVNIFAIQLALRDGFKLDMFLLDPVLFILWIYTFASLFIVGRGLFCGWLCPFGVMQSFVAWVAQKLRIRQWRVSPRWHGRLIYLKYAVLAVLMGLAFESLQLAEQGAEVEPFKTAVTLNFVREWPFVIYAVALLGLGLFINKFYCRYVCPLGAGLAVLGRFRIFSLIPRRSECGSPCQLCAVRCETAAIRKSGEIDYNECVQCLECVVILQDDTQCAPARVEARRRARGKPANDTDAVVIDFPAAAG
ncbi:MAG: 4Fe-4S binding protein [Halieaceae bacterium]|jgi:NosR/NirI family nitrous oxide reductase transcriptional regulator|nr:4Fe-4S binding protein [Halieaceae bacterium]